jgi:hypothetical protein
MRKPPRGETAWLRAASHDRGLSTWVVSPRLRPEPNRPPPMRAEQVQPGARDVITGTSRRAHSARDAHDPAGSRWFHPHSRRVGHHAVHPPNALGQTDLNSRREQTAHLVPASRAHVGPQTRQSQGWRREDLRDLCSSYPECGRVLQRKPDGVGTPGSGGRDTRSSDFERFDSPGRFRRAASGRAQGDACNPAPPCHTLRCSSDLLRASSCFARCSSMTTPTSSRA